ncbi:MAG: hypothetical protein Hyperionvirus1_83 [Hyperionvirus sp.]|uniref:Uncharacterized protein n=1 Tax=Hyperionvirus sp. TaxID=2487770 RepID=A0A3G5A7L8_9VIRU|nr:MAG: hypothetical protein Hyperionvirus1_83 [Hyperionvirus sp.]
MAASWKKRRLDDEVPVVIERCRGLDLSGGGDMGIRTIMIDWEMVKANLPFGSKHGIYRAGDAGEALKKYQLITDYLEKVCKFVRDVCLTDDVLALVGMGSYFMGDPNPTLDISFRYWMRDGKQIEFWGMISKLDEFYDNRNNSPEHFMIPGDSLDTPRKAFEVMVPEIRERWLSMGLENSANVHATFVGWLECLFPTWDKLKAGRKTHNFWKGAVKIILLSRLGDPPAGMTVDVKGVSDSFRGGITVPMVCIDTMLPERLLPFGIHCQAHFDLVSAEDKLGYLLLKQECIDYLVNRLIGVTEPAEYTCLQSGFVEWSEGVIINWLGTTASDHIRVLKSKPLPQAIAIFMRSLLPGRAVKAAGLDLRIVRWREMPLVAAPAVTPVIVTEADELLLAPIRRRILEAEGVYEAYKKKCCELSLFDIHRLTSICRNRMDPTNEMLKATAWVWACSQWTKRRHRSPDAIITRLGPQLLNVPFGTTRIIESKRGEVLVRLIQYIKPGAVAGNPIHEKIINDRNITALISLESAPNEPDAVPPSSRPLPPSLTLIAGALERYSMPNSMPFLTANLRFPLQSQKQLRWNRRRWIFLIRFSRPGSNHISILPKDLFRLITGFL